MAPKSTGRNPKLTLSTLVSTLKYKKVEVCRLELLWHSTVRRSQRGEREFLVQCRAHCAAMANAELS